MDNQELWKELLALVRRHPGDFLSSQRPVNLSSKSTDFAKIYEIRQLERLSLSYDDFEYITAMNNRADELANRE